MDSSAWWWRFHQLAAALAYGVAVALAWHVRPWLGRAGLLWFLLIVAASVVAASLRVHLWFSARTYPAELPGQRASVAGWVRAADWSATGLLILAGLSVVGSHADWSALLVAIGVANILVFLHIEPATARAAFNDQSSRRS
jgi:hypothetical protein